MFELQVRVLPNWLIVVIFDFDLACLIETLYCFRQKIPRFQRSTLFLNGIGSTALVPHHWEIYLQGDLSLKSDNQAVSRLVPILFSLNGLIDEDEDDRH